MLVTSLQNHYSINSGFSPLLHFPPPLLHFKVQLTRWESLSTQLCRNALSTIRPNTATQCLQKRTYTISQYECPLPGFPGPGGFTKLHAKVNTRTLYRTCTIILCYWCMQILTLVMATGTIPRFLN